LLVDDPVLLVSDAAPWTERMTQVLMGHGFGVRCCADLADAIALMSGPFRPLAIVLRFGEGRPATLEAIQRLRAITTAPCLAVGERLEDGTERVLGLEGGADDCVPASFTPRETVARLRAVLRRGLRSATGETPDGWRLLAETRDVLAPDGRRCGLTVAEYRVLEALMAAPASTLERDGLSRLVLGKEGGRAIDNIVSRLRRKLAGPGCNPTTLVRSVRGQGYTFTGFPGQSGRSGRQRLDGNDSTAPVLLRLGSNSPPEVTSAGITLGRS
jgi:two-component system OmpR family response regulator